MPGASQQVYCAVSGDFNGGPAGASRGDTSGVTRGALDAFWAQATAGQAKAVIALGDLTGADDNSAGYWRMHDIWGGGDEVGGAENITCSGTAPSQSIQGHGSRCFENGHTSGGTHTGYMNAAIRNVTLPIPGNHDRSSPNYNQMSPSRTYEGYWNFWRKHYTDDPGTKLRPFDMGFGGTDSTGFNYGTGPFRYYVDIPAANGRAYWRAILIDVDPWLNGGPSTQKAGILSWLDGVLADAATKKLHIIAGWHEPFINTSGSSYGNESTRDIVGRLQNYKAGFVILSYGHIHAYARWDPILWNGATNFDTDPQRGQTPRTLTQLQGGQGAFINVQSGLAGQNPSGWPDLTTWQTYWDNVSDQTYTASGNLVIARPKSEANGNTEGGQFKAAVMGPAPNNGAPPDTTTDPVSGQPGHPYGIAGFILDSDRFSIQWWGNRADYTGYPGTPNIRQYDQSTTYIWAAGEGPGVVVGGSGSTGPTITSFSPPSGPVGTSVTINGAGFTGASAVKFFNNITASYTVVSDSQITATVPASATTGAISVTVGANTATSSTSFTVSSAPNITSIAPGSGPVGTTVQINGTGFTGASAVRFNALNASSFSVVSDSQINAVVPTTATSGPVTVVVGATTATGGPFTVTSASQAAYTWESAGLFGGGGCNAVCADPNREGSFVIGGDNNGPKVTFDGGATIIPALQGLDENNSGHEMQVLGFCWSKDATTPDRVWMVNHAGVRVSNDRGRTWLSVHSDNNLFDHHGDPRPRVTGPLIADNGLGEVYYIDDNGNVWRYKYSGTTNGTGNTAVQISSAPVGSGTSVVINPSDATTIYVSTRSGVWRVQNVRAAAAGAAPAAAYNIGRVETLRILVEGTTTNLYAAADTSGIRKQNVGDLTNTWTQLRGSNMSSASEWCGLDVRRTSGVTRLVASCGGTIRQNANGNYEQIFYSADGGTTWVCLTLDDANMDHVNAMGGRTSWPWWGYGLRAGATAREKSANRWIETGSDVEDVVFDGVNPDKILAAGQQGCWMFNLQTKKAYPALYGLHSAVNTSVRYDPSDENRMIITNSDHLQHSTTTQGAFGAWYKQENSTPTGETEFADACYDPVSKRAYAVFGDRFTNTLGDVYYRDGDPQAGGQWNPLPGSANFLGGKRPVGIDVRRIGSAITILIAVQGGGIARRTYTNADALSGSTAWAYVDTRPYQAGIWATTRVTRYAQIWFASDTRAYAMDNGSGLYTSPDGGVSWTRIWTFSWNSDKEGFAWHDPDTPTTVYVSIGSGASSTLTGVYRVSGSSGTIENSGRVATKLKRPNGTDFSDPSICPAQTGGRLAVVDYDIATDRYSVYYSENGGTSFTDVTDPYFTSAVKQVFGGTMTPSGKIFVAMHGTGTIKGTPGSVAPPPPEPQLGALTSATLLQHAVTDDLTTYQTPSFGLSLTGTGTRTLIADVFTSATTNTQDPTSVSWGGLTWTKIETNELTATDATQRGLTTWYAVVPAGTTVGPDIMTVTFPAQMTGLAVHIVEYSPTEGTPASGSATAITEKAVSHDTTGTSGGTVFTVGPFTPAANSLILLHTNAVDTAAPVISSITDTAGRTYTLPTNGSQTNQIGSNFYLTSVRSASAGASPAATTITVTFNAAIDGCSLQVLEATNVNTLSPIVQARGQDMGTTQPNYSLLTTPGGNNAVVAAIAYNANPPNFTPEAGWTEHEDSGFATPATGLQIVSKVGDGSYTATGSGGGVSWTGAKIQSAGSSGLNTEVVTAAFPGNTTSGKLVVMTVGRVGTATLDTPSGWTLIDTSTLGNLTTDYMFYKQADGTTMSTTITANGGTVDTRHFVMVEYDVPFASATLNDFDHAQSTTSATSQIANAVDGDAVNNSFYVAGLSLSGSSGGTTTVTNSFVNDGGSSATASSQRSVQASKVATGSQGTTFNWVTARGGHATVSAAFTVATSTVENWGVMYELANNMTAGTSPIVQSDTNAWDGVNGSVPSATLGSPVATHGRNGVHFSSVTPRQPAAWTVESGWTEVWDSGYSTHGTGTYVANRLATTDNTFVAAGGTNGRWTANIAEIAVGSSGKVTSDLFHTTNGNAGNLHDLEHDTDGLVGASNISHVLLTAGSADTSGTTTYSTTVLADSPVGYWRLGESSGTTAVDSSGNSHPGTYTASPTLPTLGTTGLLTGDLDKAATFTTNASYVQLSNPTALRLQSAFTLEAWVQIPNGTTQEGAIIAQEYNGSSVNYMLSFFNGLTTSIKPAVGFYNGSWQVVDTNTLSLSTGAPHHVVGTWDGTTLRIYVDGALINSATPGSGPLTPSTSNYRIGTRWDNAASPYGFGGVIDEVAIYGSALSLAQIQTHYNAGVGAGGPTTSYTTASITPKPMTIMGVANAKDDQTVPEVPVITGGGLAWNMLQSVVYAGTTTTQTRRLSVYQGIGTPSTGPLTINMDQGNGGVPFVGPIPNTDPNTDLGTVDVTLDPTMTSNQVQTAITNAGDGATIEWAPSNTGAKKYNLDLTELIFRPGQKHFTDDGCIIVCNHSFAVGNQANWIDLRTPGGSAGPATNVTISDLEIWGHPNVPSGPPGTAPENLFIVWFGTFLRRVKLKGGQDRALGGQGDNSELGVVLDTCEIAYNVQNSAVDNGTSAGAKWTQFGDCGSPPGSTITVINSEIHHNWAHGLWWDIGSAGALIANNNIHDNARSGIHWEVSSGPVLIRDNFVQKNGGGGAVANNGGPNEGIRVVSSVQGQIINNTLGNNGGVGINFVQDMNPPSRSGISCPQLAAPGANEGYMFQDWDVLGNVLNGDGVNNQVTTNPAIHYDPTPVTSTVTPSAGAAWIVEGINGAQSVFQSKQASGNTDALAIDITPSVPSSLVLAFGAKKGFETMGVSLPLQKVVEVSNTNPNNHLELGAVGASAPFSAEVTGGGIREMGEIVLEVGTFSIPDATHRTDGYISGVSTASVSFSAPVTITAGGTAPVTPSDPGTGKPKKPRRRMSRVFWTIEGRPIDAHDDWEFNTTSLGGFDKATIAIPESQAKHREEVLQQEGVLTAWDEYAEVPIWQGQVTRPAEFAEGLAHVEAEGFQYDARRTSDRVPFLVTGTRDWSDMNADPYKYAANDEKYDLNLKESKVIFVKANDDSLINSGARTGIVWWAPGVTNLDHLSFAIEKSHNLDNFEINIVQTNGPQGGFDTVGTINLSGTGPVNIGQVLDRTYNLSQSNGDLVGILLKANADAAKSERKWVRITDVRVGIINGEEYTSSQVSRYLGRALGWDVSKVKESDLDIMPYDIQDEDWGAALEYVAQLDSMPWMVLHNAGHGPLMVKRHYDDVQWETSVQNGASLDLTSNPIYTRTRVLYSTPSGDVGEATAELKGYGKKVEMPPFELSDTQRGISQVAQLVAEALLAENSKPTYTGTITLNHGDRRIMPVAKIRVHDYEGTLTHRIEEVSQNSEGIEITIGAQQRSSRILARLEHGMLHAGRKRRKK